MARPSLNGQRAGVAAALSAYLIWGLLTVYWRQLHRFNAFELIGWRISSASVVMVVAVTATRRWKLVLPGLRSHALRITACALLLATNWTCYVWAVVHEHVLETALGYFISPLFTVVLGVVVLKERLRRLQVLALTLAVAAVAVLTVANGTVPWLALAIAVTVLVTPGPAVTIATPSWPVSSAWACASRSSGRKARCCSTTTTPTNY